MANTIPNDTVPAPVIQFNNHQYLVDGQYAPRTLNVPCGINALVDDYLWWAIPVKNYGIVTILQVVPAIGDNASQPTPDSISVIRIRDKYTPGYTWWVATTLEDYYAACAACCGEDPVPIPDPDLPIIVPCQLICDSVDEEGNFISIFGIPALSEGEEYVGYGQFNGEELTGVSGATLDALLTDMNTEWANLGSPSQPFTFTEDHSGGTIVLTATGGSEDDSICILVLAEVPSP